MVDERNKEENRDPITGAPGAHPAGVAAGAVAGGVTGGAVGAVAGPVGAAVGAVVGAVVGGLAGKGVAEAFDPTVEEAYWRENYRTRPYYDASTSYEEYAPAYRYGWESRAKYPGKGFSEVDSELERGWQSAKANSGLAWMKAKTATQDAWEHTEPRAVPSSAHQERKAS